jgi:hypothetical protein
MVAEAVLWAKEIIGLGSTLMNVKEAVDRLRFKKELKGDELDPVKENLSAMLKKFEYIKNIGGLLGNYIEYSKKAHTITAMSDKIDELLLDINETSTESEWRSISKMFDDVSEAYAAFISLKTGGTWLDERDSGRITSHLDNVTEKYSVAKSHLDDRSPKGLKGPKGSILQLKGDALKLESLFNDSINNMLDGLKKI